MTDGPDIGLEDEVQFIPMPTEWKVSFVDKKGRWVGELTFDESGKLNFAGSANSAAQIFFGCVVGANNLHLERLQKLLYRGSRLMELDTEELNQWIAEAKEATAHLFDEDQL